MSTAASTAGVLARAGALQHEGTPFVLATVVRAESPTSARAGDRALVLPDGTIEGFVGGSCAESTVRVEGLRLLRDRASSLLRIVPTAASAHDDREGLITVVNPCLSGGTLEIFLEAMVPPTVVHVHGDAPIARALVRIGEAMDYDVRAGGPPSASAAAVVVASHGRDEVEVLTDALRAGVPYVALVASRVRGAAVLAALDVPAADRVRVRTPAGLDLGATSPAEIALSIYAEMIGARERIQAPPAGVPEAAGPGPGLDPVCGMAVTGTAADPSAVVDGVTWWFCGPGCRQAFVDDPARFVPVAGA
ncbi:XdhC family protein [Actinomycetospora cinnamomea]|uniref:Xanthine dehydrogenase accessory factor n=1 Tax=Actinomycetospora cinnamomea TaxID=663609 RepID=A0A2U1FIF2_9PSEU|nr:XdhC family protein [Actinomycetospora cinnamomea]PVZ11962.1 xanthine dehydrogenase accessory factor [Actinomycetospora cinnamomea]